MELHNYYWSSNLPDPVYKFSIPLAHNSDVVPAMASGMTTLVTLSALRASERVCECVSECVSRHARRRMSTHTHTHVCRRVSHGGGRVGSSRMCMARRIGMARPGEARPGAILRSFHRQRTPPFCGRMHVPTERTFALP
jgi:hypothetical protein